MEPNFKILLVFAFICFAFLAGLFFLIRFLIKYNRKESARGHQQKLDLLESNKNVLAEFLYSESEWDCVFQQEFDESLFQSFLKAKSTSRRKYKDFPKQQAKIYFLQNKIIITNGPDYKEFRFNDNNSFGFGSYLMSVCKRSEQILEMKIKIASGKPSAAASPSFGIEISDETYKILIPAAGVNEMDQIVDTYKESISAESFYENFPGYSDGSILNLGT